MDNQFYVTTPIYYVNAKPHLGHAYTTIVADVITRFNKMQNKETFFLTGTDEHGDKIVKAAQSQNLSPKQYVDQISDLYIKLWPHLSIDYDYFIRTTDHSHIAIVEKILNKIYNQGDIYFSEYEGLYCYGCERFYNERELIDGNCPDHEKAPVVIKESNYFFKMSKYQNWLIDHIKSNPEFIRPKRYKNEILSFLKEPLEDLCISRPKTRLQWGITLPFDQNYVTYVWFDALINYISALGYPDNDLFKKYWPYSQHIVAKDILKPHGIYWPIMLKAAGIDLYQNLNVHGYWNVDQSKMSKSLDNVVNPLELLDKYGSDAFRYCLMRDMVFGLDANFSEKSLVTRINSDLANDLGNLFSRVTAMTHKYFNGVIPEVNFDIKKEFNLGFEFDISHALEKFITSMEKFEFHNGLIAISELIGQMNKFIDVTMPWELAKKKSSKQQLEFVIYNLSEGLRVVAGLIYPFMPNTSSKMQKHLGLDINYKYFLIDELLKRKIPFKTKIPKAVTLFPRIKIEKNIEDKGKNNKLPDIKFKPEIAFEDFLKIDLRVGTIISAEKIVKAKKLLKLEVDIGEIRTIVAGLANVYTPDELISKQVIVAANLKPAKLMGVLSKGMVLAVVEDDKCSIATIEKKMNNGAPVS